jgi:hypothetical protein
MPRGRTGSEGATTTADLFAPFLSRRLSFVLPGRESWTATTVACAAAGGGVASGGPVLGTEGAGGQNGYSMECRRRGTGCCAPWFRGLRTIVSHDRVGHRRGGHQHATGQDSQACPEQATLYPQGHCAPPAPAAEPARKAASAPARRGGPCAAIRALTRRPTTPTVAGAPPSPRTVVGYWASLSSSLRIAGSIGSSFGATRRYARHASAARCFSSGVCRPARPRAMARVL